MLRFYLRRVNDKYIVLNALDESSNIVGLKNEYTPEELNNPKSEFCEMKIRIGFNMSLIVEELEVEEVKPDAIKAAADNNSYYLESDKDSENKSLLPRKDVNEMRNMCQQLIDRVLLHKDEFCNAYNEFLKKYPLS